MTEQRKAVIKNADMSEDMQQDAVDIASQALAKYNIEKVSYGYLYGWWLVSPDGMKYSYTVRLKARKKHRLFSFRNFWKFYFKFVWGSMKESYVYPEYLTPRFSRSIQTVKEISPIPLLTLLNSLFLFCTGCSSIHKERIR